MSAEMYKTSVEYKLAFHSAPTLLGIKPASLIILDDCYDDINKKLAYFNRKAASKSIHMIILCRHNNRLFILVYNTLQLGRLINENREFLGHYGYNSFGVSACLKRLGQRIGDRDFPHEIGLFLGYPLEDIKGFIRHNGKNYKLCGYWKVYSDEQKARRTFSNYDKCREYLCNRISNGADIYQALNIA